MRSSVMQAPPYRPTPRTLPTFTWHARQRLHELHVGIDDAIAVYRSPQQIWPARDGAQEMVGKSLLLTVDTASGLVLTVKLRTAKYYSHGLHHLENLPR